MTEPRLTGYSAEASPTRAPAGWQRRELVIWGAHGGAGTSTLAVWLQPAWDMGAMRPQPDPSYPATITRRRALVVACRNTAWSAEQATKAITHGHPAWRPGGGARRGWRQLARTGDRPAPVPPTRTPRRRSHPGPVRPRPARRGTGTRR